MTENTNKPCKVALQEVKNLIEQMQYKDAQDFIAKEREDWINKHTNEPAINYHCVVCGGITSEEFLKEAYEKTHPVEPYRLCQCKSCGRKTVSELFPGE